MRLPQDLIVACVLVCFVHKNGFDVKVHLYISNNIHVVVSELAVTVSGIDQHVNDSSKQY